MTSASIISSVRTPNGRLKGYNLNINDESTYLTCDEIKKKISAHELLVHGMKVSATGALILVAANSAKNAPPKVVTKKIEISNQINEKLVKKHPPVDDPLIIHSALEISKHVEVSDRVKNSSTPVAFIKRRIT